MVIFFIIAALVVVVSVGATVHALVTDGYRPVRTDRSRLP
ncbi:hypothetical protein JOE64_000297 [Microbacterium dextranolyticum]|uniref:Uncharacterized protein n=1 Tax=Microbacterium dextranolyticum TaxID=36806 RepID=A0A9W6HJT5_9MICO|nr:hypothetical protein [Microbacterium dextranolyticum]GLJ94069.1 hypothetical protein GCM10017591_01300 [Microbacterium dextranolyticum]